MVSVRPESIVSPSLCSGRSVSPFPANLRKPFFCERSLHDLHREQIPPGPRLDRKLQVSGKTVNPKFMARLVHIASLEFVMSLSAIASELIDPD